VVIHWFRRDLRITDNTALRHAAASGLGVIPVYIASTWKSEHSWTGSNRQQFLCDCLASLARNLETVQGRLIIRHGDAIEALGQLVRETGAVAIHFNEDPDPFGKAVEARLHKACAAWGVSCHGWHDVTLHAPHEVLTKGGDPYRVYTPYSNNWLGLEKPASQGKPRALGTPSKIRSEALPTLDHWKLPPAATGILEAGERAARDRLKVAIAERLHGYKSRRDQPFVDGTSRLSQDLRFGLISIREIFAKAQAAMDKAPSSSAREGIHTFIKELAWREFYMAILHHFPHVLEHEFNPEWRGLPWAAPDDKFEAWKSGMTGFPIVDAGMRELLATGHMHNRLRMITAMFLTKDLHLDWRLGESHFMQHLVDGEIASNNGGWQWSAGTGADAAPYFRIQNPWSQSARHDPDGVYIKRWIPELRDVPAKRLHEPPENGLPLARGYPLPCVEHSKERDRTLAMFKRHKESRS
jgi:deoxyribodipyrimidine photo-lyase